MPRNISSGYKVLTNIFAIITLILVLFSVIAGLGLMPGLDTGYLIFSGAALLLGLTIFIQVRRTARQSRIFRVAQAAVAVSTAHVITAFFVTNFTGLLPAVISLLPALLLFGLATILATTARIPAKQAQNPGIRSDSHKSYFRSILLTGAGFLLLLTTGTLVSGTGSGGACPDWPLCRGEIFPANFSLTLAVMLLHRFTVVIIGVLVAAVILQTRRGYRDHPALKNWATVLGALFLLQAGLGGLYSLSSLPVDLIRVIHLGFSAVIWGSLIVMGTISYFTLETVLPVDDGPPVDRSSLSTRQRAMTFFKLTKPWVLVLLLLTTMTAMFIAAEGMSSVSLMLYTLLGGLLSAGGASVLNSYIDSDIDQVMSRTSRRATVTGMVTPHETLIFGLLLCTLSFLMFAIFVNMLSAMLSTIGIIYYVFFYTLYLKRSTIHNIVIGGAAGAIPPLVGWTAVTNSLDLGALYLFAIIFFWTPPHTWAMAMMVKKDYARARVPMLPVVVGEKETSYQIFLYSVLLIPITLLPFTFYMVGWFYLILAAILGARFLHLAWKLWHNYNSKSLSRKLYKFSQSYLALLFLIMALDRSIF